MDYQDARKEFEGLKRGTLVLLCDLINPRDDRWLFGAFDSLYCPGSSYEKYVKFMKSPTKSETRSKKPLPESEPILWELFLANNGHFIEMREARYTHVHLGSFGRILHGDVEIFDALAGNERVSCYRDIARKIFKDHSTT